MNNLNLKIIECQCYECRSACLNRPGFFLPNEIEPAALKLGLTVKGFFDAYLCVDYYFDIAFNNRDAIYLLAPKRKGETDNIAPAFVKGECIFFNNEQLCMIHKNNNEEMVKPQECRIGSHESDEEEYSKERLNIVRAWNNQEAYQMIIDLLGYEPQYPQPMELDLFKYMFKGLFK